MVAKATDSLYHITIEDISINAVTKSVTVTGVRIVPDSAQVARLIAEKKPPHVLIDATIPELFVSNVKWAEMVADKELSCDAIVISNPNIIIRYSTDSVLADTVKKRAPAIDRILAKTIQIDDPAFEFQYGKGRDAFEIKSKGGQITANNWDFYPRKPVDASRFFAAQGATLSIMNIAYSKPGGLYAFGTHQLQFNSTDHTLELDGVYIRPTVSKEDFYRREKEQKEIYEGSFPVVALQDFAWEPFFRTHIFQAGRMAVDDANLSIYLDRMQPANRNSRMGKFPHQLLMKAGVPLYIPEVAITNGTFLYTELNDKTQRPGTLRFSGIHGAITNVTNMPAAVAKDPHCYIRLAGKFMQRSDMAAMFDLMLSSKNGAFSVGGRLLNLEAGQIRDAAKALAVAEITSLQLRRMDFSIAGNEFDTHGQFTILYNNLKLKLEKVDTPTLHMHNRLLLSFLANKLLIYKDNPLAGEDPRQVTTLEARDTTKSFFNIIWRNMFDAIMQTAIRNEGVADIIKRKQANKDKIKPKHGFFRTLFPKKKRK